MDFRDRDGARLINWSDPESAFKAWQVCSTGRLCDYSGITYAKLTSGSGIQKRATGVIPVARLRGEFSVRP